MGVLGMVPALDRPAALRNLPFLLLRLVAGVVPIKWSFKFSGFEIYCLFPNSVPLDFLYKRVLCFSTETRDLSLSSGQLPYCIYFSFLLAMTFWGGSAWSMGVTLEPLPRLIPKTTHLSWGLTSLRCSVNISSVWSKMKSSTNFC